jgi:hypothetical protein
LFSVPTFQGTPPSLFSTPAPVATSSALTSQVWKFAHDHLGQKVGNGQCAVLADQALQAIHARTFWQLGPSGNNADYVWGALVLKVGPGQQVNWSQVQPGDIIQYRNVVLKSVSHLGSATYWQTWTAAHHTSVVAANLGSGRLQVYEQNVGGRQFVQLDTADFSTMSQGTIWIYRPIAAGPN